MEFDHRVSPPSYREAISESRIDDYSEVAPRPNVTPHPVISHNLEYSPGSYVNSAQLSNNNFTMIRFIFCWTGVATESSALTYYVFGCWYLILGVFGIVNVILPYSLYKGLPNTYLALYILAGLSCLLLSFMWYCTIRFFYKTHPQKRLHDTHHYRLPQETNSGYIVILFVFSCSLFGSVTLVLIHDAISRCHLFDPPINCHLPQYFVAVTAVMGITVFTFLFSNCLCYFPFTRRNAGRIC